MKNLKFLLTTLSVGAILSCSNEQTTSIEKQELSKDALETKEMILKRGYKESEIEVDFKHQYFYVEDIGFSFDWAKNLKILNKNAKNYRSATTVSSEFSNNITYYVDPSVPENFKNPIGWATYYWSRSSESIEFRQVFSSREADLVFVGSTNDNPASDSQARGEFPRANGNVGGRIQIYTNRTQPPTNDRRISLMLHEIGHNLGLEHSNTKRNSNAEYLGSITGTSKFHQENECGSIMRTPVFNCGWNSDSKANWSDADKASIDILYGYDFNEPVNN